jgi:hypothetical protein
MNLFSGLRLRHLMDVVDVASLVVARNHNQNDQPQRRNPGANA